eukprot:snap_masked-scaffold_14-processed-gene-1.10-mRNA-1 protein AED:0.01 eAED:0.04 QI:0/-1/0/1/-1/1/1/0/417
MYDLEVVIIGGGIAGLSTGLVFLQHNYTVHLYEQAPEILPVGAAISVWSNGTKAMNQLNLGQKLKDLGGHMTNMVYKNLSGETLMSAELEPLYQKVGERAVPVSRTKLQKMLMDEYVKKEGKLTLGKVAVKVESEKDGEQNSRKRVVFADGSTSVFCDLLVGADGIKSKIRNFVLDVEDSMGLVTYQYTNWNGIIPISSIKDIDASHWTMWVGKGKRASVMPISDTEFYFFFGTNMPENNPAKFDASFPHPKFKTEEMRDELKKIFSEFPVHVQQVIDAIDIQRLNRVPVCDLEYDNIPTYVNGNVVLIGDAAHATTPTLGQGGCQAMEDAIILGNCLVMYNNSIEDSLKRYEKVRKDRAEDVTRKARKRTSVIFSLKGEQDTQKWYDELESDGVSQRILDGMVKNLNEGPYNFPLL